MIDKLNRGIEGTELAQKWLLNWTGVPGTVFQVVALMLSDQTAPERRETVVELLQRYTGVHTATVSILEQARDRAKVEVMETRSAMGILAPLVAEKFGFETNDYRQVIAELKKQTIADDKLEETYRKGGRRGIHPGTNGCRQVMTSGNLNCTESGVIFERPGSGWRTNR